MINYCIECKYFYNNMCLKDGSHVSENYPYCNYGYKDNDLEIAEQIYLEIQIYLEMEAENDS